MRHISTKRNCFDKKFSH